MLRTSQGVAIWSDIHAAFRRLELEGEHSGGRVELNKEVDPFLLFSRWVSPRRYALGAPQLPRRSARSSAPTFSSSDFSETFNSGPPRLG